MKHLILFASLVAILSSCQTNIKVDRRQERNDTKYTLYSRNVGDSFHIDVKLPPGYDSTHRYPVAYVLDGNLYFDPMAATVYKYAEIGMMEPMILVGVSYKDFETMDSLRNRDLTYPLASPEDSFTVSGGGDKFLLFLTEELIPDVDAHYHTNTGARILMGHSLGGYFTVYALQQQLSGKHHAFTGYIAASPSMHYAHYKLLGEMAMQNAVAKQNIKTYITYGGMEDEEDADEPDLIKSEVLARKLCDAINKKAPGTVSAKYDIYSSFTHMEMAIPSFTRGLGWMLHEE